MNPFEPIKKILLVDDDYSNILLIRATLEEKNSTIIDCCNGSEAVQIFAQYKNEISLLLVDIKLPDCDGWTLLANLRKIKPSIPAIAISAMLPQDFYCKSKETGFDMYLSKPLDLNRLRETVRLYV